MISELLEARLLVGGFSWQTRWVMTSTPFTGDVSSLLMADFDLSSKWQLGTAEQTEFVSTYNLCFETQAEHLYFFLPDSCSITVTIFATLCFLQSVKM